VTHWGKWNNQDFLGFTFTQEKFVDVLKKQALVGTTRKSLAPKLLGINCDPAHYWRSPYLKISESMTQSKVNDQCLSKRLSAETPRNSRRWSGHVHRSCQFEILRPDLLFSLSLFLALLLSLFLSSTQSVAFSCLVSFSRSQLAISSLLQVPRVYCS